MNTRRITLASMAISALLAATFSGSAVAQADYPSKPVKIIVPFPAGGTSDVMGRLVSEELTKILKQPFVVENVRSAAYPGWR